MAYDAKFVSVSQVYQIVCINIITDSSVSWTIEKFKLDMAYFAVHFKSFNFQLINSLTENLDLNERKKNKR